MDVEGELQAAMALSDVAFGEIEPCDSAAVRRVLFKRLVAGRAQAADAASGDETYPGVPARIGERWR